MATTPSTRLMTFEEFQAIPDPPGHYLELHHGELVQMAYPKFPHTQAQHTVYPLITSAAGDAGTAYIELPYRPLPDHEAWRADVAFILKSRREEIGDYLVGAPDLVIEVLSPSNTAVEINEKKGLCLRNGSREFWEVDLKNRSVEVSTTNGRANTYEAGQQIPLIFGGSIAVDAIFA